MVTDVAIISTNLNRNILDNYKDYKIIDSNFTYEELLQSKNVIFFNVLFNLSDIELINLYNYLKKNNINYINVTNNIEEVLYTDYLIVYDIENILIEGKTLEVLKNDKLLKRLGFKLPFMVDLSLLLQDYNLIKDIYLKKEDLVGVLWK